MIWLAVFLGGGVGSVLRFGLARCWPPQSGHFPWATFAANVFATALLGALVWSIARGWLRAESGFARMLTVGLCGGFSTFSTFSMETALLIRGGHLAMAAANVGLSVLAGVVLVWAFLRIAP